MTYEDFLETKLQINNEFGFNPNFIPDYLFDFQKHLVEYSIKKGRVALFEDCGLGKSIQELVWAENVVRHTNGKVLILTPLAVTFQMQREAEKFGIETKVSRNGEINSKIVITNYEQLHNFNAIDFQGVVCDESGILKNFDGKIKNQINIFMRKIKYRLLATATPSPNDFIELGTSSEALGYLGYMDMLGKFFKNDQNNCATNRAGRFTEATKWRLKGHAEEQFWRWTTSWSRAIRKPSDLGFEDVGYNLPKLNQVDNELKIIGRKEEGKLFCLPAKGLKEQREEKKATIKQRCEKAAELVNKTNTYAVVWCNLNDEGDLLEKLIPDSIQVSGKDKDEKKEGKLIDFTEGNTRVLIIKPKIGAWGLNWQHCNHMTYFPTHSYEQYYQAVRRFYRFGQNKEVKVDLVFTEGDKNIIDNLKRKDKQATEMFENLVKHMNNSLHIKRSKEFKNNIELPKFI
jgi:hypothetical protein